MKLFFLSYFMFPDSILRLEMLRVIVQANFHQDLIVWRIYPWKGGFFREDGARFPGIT